MLSVLCIERFSLDEKTWEIVQPAAESEVTNEIRCLLVRSLMVNDFLVSDITFRVRLV